MSAGNSGEGEGGTQCSGQLSLVENGHLCLDSFATLLDGVENGQPVPLYVSDALVVHSLVIATRRYHQPIGGLDTMSLPFSAVEFTGMAESADWQHDTDNRQRVADKLCEWLSFGVFTVSERTHVKPQGYLKKLMGDEKSGYNLTPEDRSRALRLKHRITNPEELYQEPAELLNWSSIS